MIIFESASNILLKELALKWWKAFVDWSLNLENMHLLKYTRCHLWTRKKDNKKGMTRLVYFQYNTTLILFWTLISELVIGNENDESEGVETLDRNLNHSEKQIISA